MTQAEIPPGGEGKIEVTFNTSHKKGHQKKTVTVTSNDPNSPTAQLHIEANVEVEFGFKTTYLDFGRISKHDSATKTAEFEILHPDEIRLGKITTSSPKITAKEVEGEDKGHPRIEVSLAPGLPVGRLSQFVKVEAEPSTTESSTLRLIGTILGDVEVLPNQLFFIVLDDSTQAGQLEQTLRIKNLVPDHPLQILEVKDPENRLNLDLETIQEGMEYQVKATLKEETLGQDRATGAVLIETDSPEQKEIAVSYMVRKR